MHPRIPNWRLLYASLHLVEQVETSSLYTVYCTYCLGFCLERSTLGLPATKKATSPWLAQQRSCDFDHMPSGTHDSDLEATGLTTIQDCRLVCFAAQSLVWLLHISFRHGSLLHRALWAQVRTELAKAFRSEALYTPLSQSNSINYCNQWLAHCVIWIGMVGGGGKSYHSDDQLSRCTARIANVIEIIQKNQIGMYLFTVNMYIYNNIYIYLYIVI